jgi:hypothetical protein
LVAIYPCFLSQSKANSYNAEFSHIKLAYTSQGLSPISIVHMWCG